MENKTLDQINKHINPNLDQLSSSISPDIPPSIYFGGCAFGSIFYIGVYKAMLEKWGPDFMDKTIICGDSVGVIFAIGITRKFTPEDIEKMYYDNGVASPYGIFKGGIKALEEHALKKLLANFEEPLLYEKLNGKILIGGSKFFINHIWTSHWNNNEELYSCIKNSFHIPLLVDSNKKINGCHIIDGAFSFSGMDLPHGNESLYVGMNNPCAEIGMNITFSQQLFPSSGQANDYMIKKGYDAFMKWDATSNQILDKY